MGTKDRIPLGERRRKRPRAGEQEEDDRIFDDFLAVFDDLIDEDERPGDPVAEEARGHGAWAPGAEGSGGEDEAVEDPDDDGDWGLPL